MLTPFRPFSHLLVCLISLLAACAPARVPSAEIQLPEIPSLNAENPAGFTAVERSRPLTFPEDFGAHPDYSTEWWYYTGNLQTAQGRHFGFELTFFRLGLLPPTVQLPTDSQWYDRSLYFAHFAVSDIAGEQFFAFERYSRPGPGLAGAQADPYHVWLEDWTVTEQVPGVYRLQAAGSRGVEVLLRGESKMADVVDVVNRLLHGAQQQVIERLFVR